MENMSDDDGWEFVNLGDQQSFGIKTAGLEEKATACQMLVSNRAVLVMCIPGQSSLETKIYNKYSLWYLIKKFFSFGDSVEFVFQALIILFTWLKIFLELKFLRWISSVSKTLTELKILKNCTFFCKYWCFWIVFVKKKACFKSEKWCCYQGFLNCHSWGGK